MSAAPEINTKSLNNNSFIEFNSGIRRQKEEKNLSNLSFNAKLNPPNEFKSNFSNKK